MERPLFHFTPETGWLNDPNGLVYFAGEYHLFYQYVPDIRGAGAEKHWGHAVSADLVTWEHLPVALAPDERGAIWSGSAVVDWHDTSGFFNGGSGLVALFTQWRAGVQAQSLAYSCDRGRTWTKYAENPVIAAPELRVFRDPKVCWHAASGRWAMVVTIGQRVRFYTSTDLRAWRAAGEFGAGYGSQGGVWECPDLFPLPAEGVAGDERWVLLISLNGPEGSWMEYFVGDFDGEAFTSADPATTALPLDRGRDYYAAISWADVPPGDGRRLTIGWLSNWRYAHDLPTTPWRGAMTLPRTLRLRATPEGPRLVQQPVAELLGPRGPLQRWPVQRLKPGVPLHLTPDGEALEIRVSVALLSAQEFAFAIRRGEGGGITVGYDAVARMLFVERGEPDDGTLPGFGGRRAVTLALAEGVLSLHLFIDRCSLEVFAADGAVTITELFFPAVGSAPLVLSCSGGDAKLRALDLYSLHGSGAASARGEAQIRLP